MFRTTVLLALAALACQAASPVDDVGFAVASDAEQLYNSVKIGDLDSAVAESKNLVKQNKGYIIGEVVDKLIQEGQRKLIDYAFHLNKHDGQDLIKKYFPIQFRIILGSYPVKLISKRDGMAIKLGTKIDSSGDRGAYGDSSDLIGKRMAWNFIPDVAKSGEVYFKLYNVLYNQYLKLGTSADSDGEHTAYGSTESDTDRHLWYLLPEKFNGDVLFYIFNAEYHQALKLGRSVDSEGDRTVYSQSGDVSGQPQVYAWDVQPM